MAAHNEKHPRSGANGEDEETLLEFPCAFPIKAFGRAAPDFRTHVVAIVARHAPATDHRAVRTRDSGQGRYTAVTVTITARSREQLDAIYEDLTADEVVIMAL